MKSMRLVCWCVVAALALGATGAAAGGTQSAGWVPVGAAGFSAGEVNFTSLALDGQGRPTVAFSDVANGGKATVMRFVDNAWALVGSAGFSAGWAEYTSLALDGQGSPTVAYADQANGGKATVLRFDGSDWVAVGAAGFSSGKIQWPSLALDGQGRPTVAYRDEANGGKATVMRFDGNVWVVVGAAGFSAGGIHSPSLALDGQGSPTVAYKDSAHETKATVMRFDESAGWVPVGAAGFSAGAVETPSLALDGDGVPTVAYRDGAHEYKATVMRFDGSDWAPVGAAGFSAGGVFYPSLALDGDGMPTVAYADQADGGKATVMRFDGSAWGAVGAPGFSAGAINYTRLALDGQGKPTVAYKDEANGGKATVMRFRAPKVAVEPSTLEAGQCPGAQTTQTLDVCNNGDADLTWSLAEDLGWLSADPAGGTLEPDECADVTVTFDSVGVMPGTYSGSLLVNSDDPANPTVTVAVSLAVWAPPSNVGFTWTPAQPYMKEPATFQATAQGWEPAYAWDFGDGTVGSGQTVTHNWLWPRRYTVKLTATNACGSASALHWVTVRCKTPVLHVHNIVLTGLGRSPNRVRATVEVRDQNEKVVPLARVQVQLQTPGGQYSAQAYTNASGIATFTMQSRMGGKWQLCVVNLAKLRYSYWAEMNHETCDSLRWP